MIGVDRFSSLFGGAPEHTRSHLPEHVRAIIRAGYSPVLCAPGTGYALCTLSPTVAKRTGDHPCGHHHHVIDDPAKSGAIVKRLLDQYGSLNIGLHLGRSGLAVLRHDSFLQPSTVLHPAGGDTWYTLQPGDPSPAPRSGIGWALLAGDQYALVPPAQLPHGAYRLVGGTTSAPAWML